MQAQIIGTSSESNVAPSILVTSDNVKLLFNAGEGTKRVCKEHGNLGTKITKLNYLFLTELDWSNWSGIADIVFYLNDTTTKELTIMGPTNLTDLAIATRYTLFCPEFTMKLREIDEATKPVETRDGLKVVPIVVKKPVIGEAQLLINQSFADAMEFYLDSSDPEEIPHIKAMQQSAESALKLAMKNKASIESKRSKEMDLVLNFDCKSVVSIPPPCPMAISYCIQTPTVTPKIDMQKAKALGINPGPMIGQLSKGNSVTLPSGTVVKPEDVMNGPAQPGPMLAIVTCPGEDMLDEFVDHPKWAELANDPSGAKIVSFIHLTPASILGNPKYIAWMMKFGATADHIVANGENCHHKHIFLKSKRLFGLLNAVDHELFPSPFESDQLLVDLPKSFAESGAKITIAEPLMKYILQPVTRMGIDNSAYSQVLEKKSPYEKIITSDSFKALKQAYDAQKAKEVAVEKYDGAELVMLGTTSADPSDVRNESGIYLNLFERGGLIMDCGSGTYGQLSRRYGPKIDEVMANLKCIWISHKHGDHHAGLIMLLEKRQQYIKKLGRKITPLVLIAPRFIEGYVHEVSMITGVQLHYQYYHNKDIAAADHSLTSFFASEMDLTLVRNVPVIHATDSWGLLIEHQRGWRILFSGDTRPTHSLIDLVGDKQCDLATMKDKDRELAVKKNHSTTSEALFMASKLNPYRVLLTHFSQRQSIIPVVDFVYPEPLPVVDIRSIKTDEKTSSFRNLDMHNITHLSKEEIVDIGERVSEDKVSIAFDLMTIHLSNLQTIPLTLPIFKYLYQELKNLLGKDIEQ